MKKKITTLSVLVLTVVTVYFSFNVSTLDNNATQSIESIIQQLSLSTDYTIHLSGHSDNIGSDTYNGKLSEQRVIAVKNYLIAKNIDSTKIRLDSYGECSPAVPNTFGDEYPKALEFMSNLPLFLDIQDALVVHGYFEPGVPVEQQLPSVLCGTMGGDRHLKEHYSQPWYELYDGNKPILVGHLNYSGTDQPFVYRDRVFGLDTDCVTGKSLTGLILPSFRLISVPSRANHWLQVRRMFPVSRANPQLRPVEIPWKDSEWKTCAC